MNKRMTVLMSLTVTVQFVFAEPPSPVPKTGQTTSYRAGDDGDLEPGVAWPNPRFTVITNGVDAVVNDNLTGLEWVKEPHSLSGNSGSTNWNSAVDFCNNLVYAGHSDWRLPSRNELLSLIDYGRVSPALPAGHPFVGVKGIYYLESPHWSSTSFTRSTDIAFTISLGAGNVYYSYKTGNGYVWPVRGGQ